MDSLIFGMHLQNCQLQIHVAFSYPLICICCAIQELTVIIFIKSVLHILQFYMDLGLGYTTTFVSSVLCISLLVSNIKGYFKLVTQSKGMFWPPIFSTTSKSRKPAIYCISFLFCTDDSLTVVTAKPCLKFLFLLIWSKLSFVWSQLKY